MSDPSCPTLKLPKNETARLQALSRYAILDTPSDGSFDHLTKIAASYFNVPIAIISLVDADRIWFKSHFGVDAKQVDRVPGLCSSAILQDDVYIVESALDDDRTLANPLVTGQLGLRFYAAAPLKTSDGFNLGTVCVADKKPRYFSAEQQAMLPRLAQVVMEEMELRLASRQLLREVATHLKETVSAIQEPDRSRKQARLESVSRISTQLVEQIQSRIE
jgi:GAF domain-containing protein